MGRECNLKQQSIQGWTPNLIWSDKKVKTKNWHGSFETNSIFRTSVHGFSPDLSRAYLCTPSRFVLHTHFFESFEKKKPGWQSVGSNSTESELFSVEYTSVNIIVRFFLRLLLYTPSVSRNENDTDSLGTITNKLSSSRSFCALFSRSISNAKTLVITSPPSSSTAFRLNGTSSPGETWNKKSYKTFRASVIWIIIIINIITIINFLRRQVKPLHLKLWIHVLYSQAAFGKSSISWIIIIIISKPITIKIHF